MRRLFVPLLSLSALALSSCSSEEIRTEPSPVKPVPTTVALQFKLGTNTFTRAEEGNEVESLRLAFFNSNNGSPLFLQVAEAVRVGDSNLYSALINVTPDQTPDMVVAFVNFPDDSLLTNAESNTPTSIASILSDAGNLLMSSPCYYDEDGKRIYYTTFDYEAESTINLEMERLAAKVKVSADVNSETFPAISARKSDGSNVTLTLNLTGWGINSTDKETYLLRQTAISEWETELSWYSDWNNPDANQVYWAKSLNYGVDFTDAASAASKLNLITITDATNGFGGETYSHESTRKYSTEATPAYLPSVILAGEYSIGENDPETFYRIGNTIFLEAELLAHYLRLLGDDLKYENTNLTADLLTQQCELTAIPTYNGKALPSSFVALQLKADSNGSFLKDGAALTSEEVNELLLAKCGVAEMFKDGKCYFTAPVEHKKVDTNILYGLVRNHQYNVNIKGISGWGHGVKSTSDVIKDEVDYQDEGDPCYINFSVTIREWEEVEQDVTIKKN